LALDLLNIDNPVRKIYLEYVAGKLENQNAVGKPGFYPSLIKKVVKKMTTKN
jgi:hypothetical protein